jgi:hypothetical protein
LATIGLAAVAPATPLDLGDPTPRALVVEFETSADLSTVGTLYGESVPAIVSVDAGTATITIAGDDFEALFAGGSIQVDSSDIVIEIDTNTGSASVVSATGTVTSPFVAYSWSWTLDTSRTAGWVDGSGFGPLHCTSQAEIDALCPSIPAFCGATCEIVPGATYDTQTGGLNMVGFEHQDGCGETGCMVVDFFTGRGDLRLSEAPQVPALPLPFLGFAVVAIAAWTVTRGRPRRSIPQE